MLAPTPTDLITNELVASVLTLAFLIGQRRVARRQREAVALIERLTGERVEDYRPAGRFAVVAWAACLHAGLLLALLAFHAYVPRRAIEDAVTIFIRVGLI